MRVIICGASGQLGTELVKTFEGAGQEVLGFDRDLDITDYDRVRERIPELRPDLLINAAADTDLDRAELDPEPSHRVNYTGTQNLALACRATGCPMVFLSTDYVFDGTKGSAYNEFDLPNPQGVYAKCKLAAESYMMSVLEEYFIFRTAWLFGKAGQRNFIKSILYNAKSYGSLSVVVDEVGTPTYAADLAETIYRVCASGKYGLYHATNEGICSRFEFAQRTLEIAGWDDITLKPIIHEELGLPCPRPANTALDNLNLRLQGFPPMRHYHEPLKEYVEWLLEEDGFLDGRFTNAKRSDTDK
ncbi:MAG: dTDP-4-dehydrorhamnose reductase [Candidatus Solincola sediminis]|uniref:dTDP-4-dehydrorhamnose reductase n=1 Tax=Candidatus Solincola sediminis TaxID=1797199 RepID=A0A1F2WJ19_9ACTN|nr:MAG: dTDP-4-dehydrorhamnose reductase [Candidatus Solincola sediminis]OFW57553.1 MAG: dTDP-4-dehydrorhamnose reductase [Candidatus Solincola sediminis]